MSLQRNIAAEYDFFNGLLGFYEETEPARQVWVQERLLRILRGEACLVAAGIRRSATRRKLTPDNRENVDQCADYLLNHASYLHYDECLAAGFRSLPA